MPLVALKPGEGTWIGMLLLPLVLALGVLGTPVLLLALVVIWFFNSYIVVYWQQRNAMHDREPETTSK